MNKEQVVIKCAGHDPKQMTAKTQHKRNIRVSVCDCVVMKECVLRPPRNSVGTGTPTDFLIGHVKATVKALCFGRLISELFSVMGLQIHHR